MIGRFLFVLWILCVVTFFISALAGLENVATIAAILVASPIVLFLLYQVIHWIIKGETDDG